MLTIHIDKCEEFNELTSEFIIVPETTLQLEHSLISISKWESKWHKAFLRKNNNKTREEMMDYIRCMTINNVNPLAYDVLSSDNINAITNYIEDKHTAVYLNTEGNNLMNGKTVEGDTLTSDLIYYMMLTLRIPFDPCQKWHLNRLLTLIHICNIKNNKESGKLSNKAILSRNAEINRSRRAKLKSKG